jgi:hypothetical protein
MVYPFLSLCYSREREREREKGRKEEKEGGRDG